MTLQERARQLLRDFKGDDYAFGLDVYDQVGAYAAGYGDTAFVISNTKHCKEAVDKAITSLEKHGVKLAGGQVFLGARPNSPKEDVERMAQQILSFKADSLVVIGGGSAIDAAKAANVLATFADENPVIESFFGTGLVTAALERTGKKLLPFIAVQTVSASAAHLTKYSNVTDFSKGQKKLIVDNAVTPERAVFDYGVTKTMPADLTSDGVLDGLSHCLEVFYGIGVEHYHRVEEITKIALELALTYTPRVLENPHDLEAREALGLVTDLGGYAIMLGGTSGAHLTSFSLVDVTSHGRACGIMNLYYTVFFAPAIEERLRVVGEVFRQVGLLDQNLKPLRGADLGLAVANALRSFYESINFPRTLQELPGFSEDHIERALIAAQDPQLEMKLRNMPVPLDASLVRTYMAPILAAAKTGDFSLIEHMKAF